MNKERMLFKRTCNSQAVLRMAMDKLVASHERLHTKYGARKEGIVQERQGG